jgi:hypothetical protein
MGRLINSKLKAFTLLETMVALVIIFTVFGITTAVITQTALHGISIRKLRAESLLNEYAGRTIRQKEFFNAEERRDDFLLRREMTLYPGYDSLLCIHYYIYNPDRQLLHDWQQLIVE